MHLKHTETPGRYGTGVNPICVPDTINTREGATRFLNRRARPYWELLARMFVYGQNGTRWKVGQFGFLKR